MTDCNATIEGRLVVGGGRVQCTRQVHTDGNHVGPKRGDAGRAIWTDWTVGATPHRSEETTP